MVELDECIHMTGNQRQTGRVKKNPIAGGVQTQEDRFAQDVIVRGEAVKICDGKLPPGATHEIIESNGKQQVVRRRFSAV